MVSAGSSVGARDETAGVVAAARRAGHLCHGLAIRPGKPTLLADCGGVPVIGLPGNPLSALVVFRLVGLPVVRRVGGHHRRRRRSRPCGPGWTAQVAVRRPAGSTSCRSG